MWSYLILEAQWTRFLAGESIDVLRTIEPTITHSDNKVNCGRQTEVSGPMGVEGVIFN